MDSYAFWVCSLGMSFTTVWMRDILGPSYEGLLEDLSKVARLAGIDEDSPEYEGFLNNARTAFKESGGTLPEEILA